MGEMSDPCDARHPKCREYQLGSRGQLGFTQTCRLKAWECPFSGHRILNTPIMSILCNAMQFKVQRRMPDPDGVRFRARNPPGRRPRAESLFDSGKNPSPCRGEV